MTAVEIMVNKYRISLLRMSKLFVFLMGFLRVTAQGVEIGSTEDYALRMLQLQGKLDQKYSLMARPFFKERHLAADSIYKLIDDDSVVRIG